MEAAEALGEGVAPRTPAAIRDWARSRSRAFWAVAGLSLLAAGLRFATLGVQSYHHDEIVTAVRVLHGSFGDAMNAVNYSESAPPLYYALAWLWSQATGTGEFGLRALSALAGVATVPVAYLIGEALRGRRAGIAAAALVAVNPMLLWYSQEARGYALFTLLTAISALYFVRSLDRGRRADLVGWGIASALALATHYFAFFPIAVEALWLLRRRGRASLAGLWIVFLAGLLLAPLMIHQTSIGHAEWIGEHALVHRLWETGATFMVGETGEIIARPDTPLPALLPFLIVAAALLLLVRRGQADERRSARVPLVLAAATVVLPVALALVVPGKDYVLARNLMPALVPLLAAAAIGVTLRGAGRSGAVVGAALFAYSLGFCLLASLSPALQRPDWDAVAGRLGEASAPRAVVTWTLGQAPLHHYLSGNSVQAFSKEGLPWLVHEVDFVSDGPVPPVPARLLGSGFRQVASEPVGRLYLRRYSLPGPDLARLRLRAVREADLGFRSNGVLVDGIGPG
jgi:4-amino-4-deoxy-L-arabinose transferase-like glycosyltransferase